MNWRKRNSLSFGNCTFTLKMFSFELVFPFPIGIDQLCFLLWSQCTSSKKLTVDQLKQILKLSLFFFIFISCLSEIFMTVVTALFMVACHSRYQNIQLTQSHKKFGGSKIYCSTQKNNRVLSGCHKKKKIIQTQINHKLIASLHDFMPHHSLLVCLIIKHYK